MSFCTLQLLLGLTACTLAGYDSGVVVPNALQKQSAIDSVNLALSTGNCSSALVSIASIYGSISSDNAVRLATASAYGCSAGVNIFGILSDLLSFPEDLGGPGFWDFLVAAFPSTANPDDRKPVAGENGMDALFAALKPGTILLSQYSVNNPGNNPGSLFVVDRIDDANSYLMFFGMAVMGALMNRDGAPTANYHKSVNVPWTTPATAVGNGCRFSAALLNFYDSLQFVSANAPTGTQAIYNSINSFLNSSLNAACDVGCRTNGCTMGCSTCPTTLRNRASCNGTTSDSNSCAAAGLATFLNASWSGPP